MRVSKENSTEDDGNLYLLKASMSQLRWVLQTWPPHQPMQDREKRPNDSSRLPVFGFGQFECFIQRQVFLGLWCAFREVVV